MAGKVVFAALLLASVVAGGTLLASHTYALPRPDAAEPRFAAAMKRLAAAPRWTLVHVLYGRCQCSASIVDHLAQGPRPDDASELVVAVDPPAEWGPRLAARGIAIRPTTASALERDYGVAAAPLLVVLDAAGEVAYSGGYTTAKQSDDIEDVQIFASLRARIVPHALPIFGCATARELADAIDPLGLKKL